MRRIFAIGVLHLEARRRLRVLATLGGIAIVGAPVAAAVLLRTPALAEPPPAIPASPSAGFPAPPSGAVVYSRQAGSEALALGIVPRRGSILLQATVVGPQGHGSRGLTVDFVVQRMSVRAIACGPGCYRAALVTNGRPAAVEVALRRGLRTIHWRVALPASWPPPDASGLIARAEHVWRSLDSLSFREQLASDSRTPLESTWRVEAPDRIAYQVKAGWARVIIGTRRWDRSPGAARWVASAQTRLSQPVPSWVDAVDAHVIGAGTVRGHPVWRISFFDPGTPGWFEIALERKTLRTLETHMITASHFMSDVYSAFNTSPAITQPVP
jgi:hypothetical protein